MSRTESATHFTVTIPKSPDQIGITVPSIRSLCLDGIFHERSNTEIAALILRYHPTSAPASSAKKMSKHINWYRSRCRTVGTAECKALDEMIARRDEESGLVA
jgi:hypothetical protein